jgi:hypothetical protein
MFEWKIVMYQPIQGFRKTLRVTAPSMEAAIVAAASALRAKGYNPDLFRAIEALWVPTG